MSAPMFRHDKPQAGRYREHHQFGCEALGEGEPAIDAELIGLLYHFYTQLGMKTVQVAINSIGDQVCRPAYIETLRDYYRPLLDSCCEDCQVRFHKNPLRLLDCKEPQDQEKIANAPKISDHLCDPCKEHFTAVQRFLRAYEVPFVHDPLIVRGLDYYTRTVFEFNLGSKLALNGGGRYDGLAEILGGRPTPGIGFGAGIERIILELKRQGITPPVEQPIRVFVAYLGRSPELKGTAVEVVAELRKAGIKAEMSYGDRSAKAQMRQANASGALYAVIVREDEQGTDRIVVRYLQAEGMELEHKQLLVRRNELVQYITTGEAEVFSSEGPA
jgi:histidyl-tRNA synthetase